MINSCCSEAESSTSDSAKRIIWIIQELFQERTLSSREASRTESCALHFISSITWRIRQVDDRSMSKRLYSTFQTRSQRIFVRPPQREPNCNSAWLFRVGWQCCLRIKFKSNECKSFRVVTILSRKIRNEPLQIVYWICVILSKVKFG